MIDSHLKELLEHTHVEAVIKTKVIEDSRDAVLRRIKDYALFFSALAMIFAAFIYCGWLVHLNPNDKYPFSIDAGIISALLGYLAGKKSA